HRRTYVGAMPGRIIQALKQAKSRNPVILLDEVDKLGVSLQGDPSSALLEVLDPAQNHEFTDHYLGMPFDLSEVLFIATANYVAGIPAPLYDRMEPVEFRGYTEQEKKEIAERYLIPRQREEAGLEEDEFRITSDALRLVISSYTREAGVRQLEREIGKLARKAARRIASGRVKRVRVNERLVRELLGRSRVHPEKAGLEHLVGVATGMYYTPMGGDIMFIEVSAQRHNHLGTGAENAEGPTGSGSLVLTGQLGDVMKESARAALTYARANAVRFGLDPRKAWGSEIHIHVPAGAIPKDGPSAGVAMTAALVSALSDRPVRSDVAMTGEVTLTGRVLPIGGVKEKLLGAYRAGIKTIILPQENEADLEDLPKEVTEALEIHPVSTIDQALAIALEGATFADGNLRFPTSGLQRGRPESQLHSPRSPRRHVGDGSREPPGSRLAGGLPYCRCRSVHNRAPAPVAVLRRTGRAMKAIVITRPGGPEVLEEVERPIPEPGPSQIRVRVRASALNRADLLQRRGLYPAPPGAPSDIPGLEYAGEVDAVGSAAGLWAVGSRVMGIVGGGRCS